MKKIVIVVIALVVLGLGGFYLLADGDDSSPSPSAGTDTQSTAPAGGNGAQPNNSAGSYVDYSDNVIASTSGTKLLFFHAPWCPQCRALEADIKSQGVPAGVTIIKVDYDTMQELRQKYGVTIQTTIVKVDDSGNLVDKYVAYDYPNLQSVVDNLL